MCSLSCPCSTVSYMKQNTLTGIYTVTMADGKTHIIDVVEFNHRLNSSYMNGYTTDTSVTNEIKYTPVVAG